MDAKVINITVDINNIPANKPNLKKASIGNAFTAFRNHQSPRRFQTPPKKFQPHVSRSQNQNTDKRNTNQAPSQADGTSKSWQKVAQKFWSKSEGAPSENGAKLVAPIVLKLQQKPNKLVSFHHHTITTATISTAASVPSTYIYIIMSTLTSTATQNDNLAMFCYSSTTVIVFPFHF